VSRRASRRKPSDTLEGKAGTRPPRWVIPGGYVLAGAFFVWTHAPLLREGFWRDDGISVAIARAPSAAEFLRRLSFLDSQPPLFPGSVALWGRGIGWNEASLKALAFLWGAAAVGAMMALAAVLFGSIAGIAALVLGSTHPLLATMPSDLRPYAGSIVCVCLALAGLFGSRAWSPRARLCLLAPLFVLLVYSQYTGTLAGAVIGAVALAGCARPTSRAFWWPVLTAAVLAGLLFVPWLRFFNAHRRIGLPWDPSLTASQRLSRFPDRLAAIAPWTRSSWSLACALGAAIVVFVALAAWPRVRPRLRASFEEWGLVAACGLAVFFAMSLFADPVRYLVVPAALLSVLAAGALARLPALLGPGKLRVAALTGSVLIVGGCLFAGTRLLDLWDRTGASGSKSGARELCAQLSPGPRDLLLVVPDFAATSLRYYCGDHAMLRGFPQWEDPEVPRWDVYRELWKEPAESVPARIDALIARGEIGRLWWIQLEDTSALRSVPGVSVRLGRLALLLPQRFPAARTRRFPGRLESLVATELRPVLAGDAPPIIPPR
jgi:hypothetical protein